MKTTRTSIYLSLLLLTLLLTSGCASSRHAQHLGEPGPLRMVVVPNPQTDPLAANHHLTRKAVAGINRQLVRYGIDAVNSYAPHNSSIDNTGTDLCKQYATDGAILISLEIKKTMVGRMCKAKATLFCEGYDSSGSDLGISMTRQYQYAASSCDTALNTVVDEAAYSAGNSIARHLSRKATAAPPANPDAGGDRVSTPPPKFD